MAAKMIITPISACLLIVSSKNMYIPNSMNKTFENVNGIKITIGVVLYAEKRVMLLKIVRRASTGIVLSSS